jgi:uncharacterized protein involved in cysteine biosynthesis
MWIGNILAFLMSILLIVYVILRFHPIAKIFADDVEEEVEKILQIGR